MGANQEPTTIMIVDDTPANLQLLETMLQENSYRVISFPRGSLALKAAEKSNPDLVLLDIDMPEMSGYRVCELFKSNERLRHIPIIFISGLNETMDKVRAFSAGGVDYITKPFQLEEVQSRINTHLQLSRLQLQLAAINRTLEEKVRAGLQEIHHSQQATIFVMAKLCESRDDDTGRHLERIQRYSCALAERLGKDSPYAAEITPTFVENIFLASPLHDIGKIAIPDSLLLKPDKLSPEEFAVMKTHTTIGAKTLATALAKYPKNVFLRTGVAIARSHHERWDGSGYPDGAAGTEIPLFARIVALADVYDALRSNRCYRQALSHKESCSEIMAGAGTQFDPHVVAAFGEISAEFEVISSENG